MQTRFPDASRQFKSLDDIFYFGGQNPYDQVVVAPHVAKRAEEINLEVGDHVGIAGNHWDGYSMGTNRRTGQMGLYPSYKAVDFVEVEPFLFDEKFEPDSS
jgi:glycoprotein 6-alpha-L-fucosyltransferase